MRLALYSFIGAVFLVSYIGVLIGKKKDIILSSCK